jgi:hypothetical protein
VGAAGYIVQFNRKSPPDNRMQCIAGSSGSCSSSVPIGQIYIWQIQVSVHLKNTATANQYLKLLGGDCLSSSAGSFVTQCPASGVGTGNFVVWNRLPALANTGAMSDYWLTMPTISQFKQMYTTYPITTLTDGAKTNAQYFTCGN